MQTWYYITVHLEALQASFLSETNVYLGYTRYFGGHLGIGIKMCPPNKQKQKHNFNTRNGFVALKLLGLEVLLWYLCYIGQNLGTPQIQDVILAAILDLASRWSPNIILTPETDFFALKLVGIDVLL